MRTPSFFPLLVLLLGPTISRAELPSIRFDRLFPLGAAAGSTVEVEIFGAELDGVKSLWFDHPGLKATHVKDRRFRIAIAPDVPAGTYDVWLVGRFGVSNSRLLAISHGLAELTQKKPNHDPATAQRVDVNSVVNGLSESNREDLFRFSFHQGQRVVIECQAGKLDSMLEATLALTAADGRQLASSSHYFGRDPLIDFIAPADGDFLVGVHDLSFRGGQPYRLVITDHPQVENVFPRAVQSGRETTLTVYGRNLGPAAKRSTWSIQNLPLDEYSLTVTPPPDLLTQGAFRFFEHPSNYNVLPTAATCTLTGFQVQPQPGKFPANAVPLLIVSTPVTLETEPNDDPERPQPITLPAVVSGRFDRPLDADWYEFEAPADGAYAFQVYSESIGGRADPYLAVLDDKGNRLAELDDYGHRVNAFDGHLRDPYGLINLRGKQRYRVLVQDRYRRGGARFQYVLSVRQPVPDLYAAVIHHENPGPAGTTVRRGGAAYLDVVLHGREGLSGPVTLTTENLPPGLHAVPTPVAADGHGTFVLWADANAAEWTGPIALFATARRGDLTLRREVRPYTRVWPEANVGTSRPMRSLPIAVRDSAPFDLHFTADSISVDIGKRAELKLHLDRRWPDFTNKLSVLPLSIPPGFKLAGVEIPPGKNDVTLSLDVPANASPGPHVLAVLGQAQIPLNKDPHATQRTSTLVSQPSRPIKLVVLPAKKP